MHGSWRHDYIVACLGIDILLASREADCAFSDEECLIVHPVPVLRWSGGVCGNCEGGGAEAVVSVSPVLLATSLTFAVVVDMMNLC
jgi:hypothetical protein